MLKSIEGVYRKGKVELIEPPGDVGEETRVIVTFLASNTIALNERGVDEVQASELRASLTTFAEDWDSPDMDIYNDYDAAKSRL